MGPAANSVQWNAPICKYKERVAAISSAQPAVSIASYTYNVRAVPVLAYVAQLCFLPCNFQQTERSAMQAVLRLATNAFSHSDFFAIQDLGGPSMRSALVTAFASMYRTAISTISCWRAWVPQSTDAAFQSLPLSSWWCGFFWPDFWGSRPLAFNLQEAAGGFLDFEKGQKQAEPSSLRGPRRIPPGPNKSQILLTES